MAPGWKPDRGKVYILMGPPDTGETMGPAEIWKYQVPPQADAVPDVTFRFGRNSEGEYHMGHQEYSGRGALRYWDPTAETDGPAAGETFLAVRSGNGTPQIMKGRVLLQCSFTLEPGAYTAIVTILDTKSHRGVRRTETLDAPDFGRGLTLSSIAVGRLRDDAAGGGGPALIPEPDSAFHPGET